MAESEKNKSDPHYFPAEPSWEPIIGSNHGFGFDDDYKDSTVLSEFGWNNNIPIESSSRACGSEGGFLDFSSIELDLTGTRSDEYFPERALSTHWSDHISRSSCVQQTVVKENLSVSASPHPSVSSSSSEDQSDKSTASITAADPPPESASKTNKKKGPKRIRQARIAFLTKSEVDNLEDGYRWRKYGQKAVKNSPFPRSYFRCTNSKCMVKKRVERSSEDASLVITTYEGQHSHHSIGFPRASLIPQHAALFSSNSYLYHPIFPNSLQIANAPQYIQGKDGKSSMGQEASTLDGQVGEGLLGDIVLPSSRKDG